MLKINGTPYPLQRYPDGTLSLRLTELAGTVEITWLYENDEEMAALYFVAMHLKEQGSGPVDLYLPYVPNARMDRVKNPDEVFTLRYFAEFINLLAFRTVYMKDVHSSVAGALIRHGVNVDIRPTVKLLIQRLLAEGDIVFYPDEGACKRYEGLTNQPHAFGVKSRNWRTGEIQSLDIMGNMPEKPFNALIIDDICSYGGTFLKAAQRLKEAGAQQIWLYVTHCEKNILKGELPKSGLIQRVFTTESIFHQEDQDFVEVLPGSSPFEREE